MNIEVNSEKSRGITPAQIDTEKTLPQQRTRSTMESVGAAALNTVHLEYKDSPLEYPVEARLIAQTGSLASDAAEVVSGIEVDLVELQHDPDQPSDKKEHIESRIADVQAIRQTMTDVAFNPEVVKGIWADLINTPIPKKPNPADASVSSKDQNEIPAQDIFVPTPEDVVIVVEALAQEWRDDARTMVEEPEKKDLL